MPDEPAAEDLYGGDNNTMQDPEVAIQPQSTAPPVEPGSGELGGTRGADGPEESQPQEEEEAPTPLPEFDPKYRDEFQGLLYVGKLTDTFTWMSHRFIIRTLTTEELFTVALAVKPFEGSQAAGKAYQASVCAACVVSVDGRSLPGPISRDEDDHALRFNYIKANWYPPTIEAVYNRYFALEVQVRQVIDAMGKVSG